MTPRLRDRWWLATLGILLLGALLRLWRIVYELPLGADVDSFKFVGEAARVVATGELKPHEFQYPTALRNLLAILYWVGGVTTPRGQHGVARVVAALFGVGMIAATWRACRGLCGPAATALAVALVAIAVEAVTSSRVAGTDTMMACLMALALVQAAQILEGTSTWQRAAAAGALIGLAASTKYTGVVAAPFLAAAIVIAGARSKSWSRMARDLGVAAGATIAAFIIASPWFFSELSSYLGRLRVELMLQRYGQLGHVHAGFFDYLFSTTTTPEQPWLGTSLLYNGGLVMVAGLAAVGAALMRGGRARFFAVYVVFFLAAFSGPGRVKAIRFLLPALPFVAVLIAWGLERATTHLRLVAGVAAAALLAVPAYRTARYLALYRSPSTIALARAWMADHVPPRSRVFLSPLHLPELRALPIDAAFPPQAGSRQYRLPPGAGPNPERNPLFDAELASWIVDNHTQYAALDSYTAALFAPTPENLRWFPRSVESYQAFLTALRAHAEVAFSVAGLAEGRYGPDIVIYRLR